jgi:hypothetical protein
MAWIARGKGVLKIAKEAMKASLTTNELRMCQVVIFPLEYGMTIARAAACIGRSVRWTTQARNAFIQSGGFPDKKRPGGRNRENLSVEEEKIFLAPFFEKAKTGEILVVSGIHKVLEERLGRKIALASAYNLPRGHGWRKLAPDKRRVGTDPEIQETWKKLPETLKIIQSTWAQGKTIRLMFQDEARFGRVSESRRRWRPKPERSLYPAMVTQECTYAYGVVSIAKGSLDSLVLPRRDTDCMRVFLKSCQAAIPKATL